MTHDDAPRRVDDVDADAGAAAPHVVGDVECGRVLDYGRRDVDIRNLWFQTSKDRC